MADLAPPQGGSYGDCGKGRHLLNRLRAGLLALLALCASPALAEIEVEKASLGHGVSAWYAENHSVPVVDVVISFEGAGSASDPEGKGGRAAFAASMLTEGTKSLDSVAFRRALEERAITMDAEAEQDRLQIHIYCLKEHAPRAGALLAEALKSPRLDPADQARMKAELASILAHLKERPNYQAERLLAEKAFAGHPYANPPYGTETSLASLEEADVRRYLASSVTRGNVLIAAAGDVDEDLLQSMLSPVVDALADGDAGPVSVPAATLHGAGETVHGKTPAPQTAILFAAPGIARDDPRFYAAYLLNHILGGGDLTSRLSTEVRQQKGLVYSIGTDLSIRRGVALLSGALATRNARVEEALAATRETFNHLRDKGVTEQECADAKSDVLGSFARRMDGNGAVASLLLSMQIHHLGEDYIQKRDGYFNAVKCQSLDALAKELLDPARFLFVAVGGEPETKPLEK